MYVYNVYVDPKKTGRSIMNSILFKVEAECSTSHLQQNLCNIRGNLIN